MSEFAKKPSVAGPLRRAFADRVSRFDEAFRAGVLGQQEAYSKVEPQAAIDAFIAKNAR